MGNNPKTTPEDTSLFVLEKYYDQDPASFSRLI
jgi:hypothetical protein